MKAKNTVTSHVRMPKFLSKLIEEKKAIQEAISTKKPLEKLSKEKGIHFAKPL